MPQAKTNRTTHVDIMKLSAWMSKQAREFLATTADEIIGTEAAKECQREKPFAMSTVRIIREEMGIEKSQGGSRVPIKTQSRIFILAKAIDAIAKEIGVSEIGTLYAMDELRKEFDSELKGDVKARLTVAK